MRLLFKSKKLEALYTELKGEDKYEAGVVDAFFNVMSRIVAASNEQDLREPKSRRLEKLVGDKKGKYSMRLNKQWRLILTIEEDKQGKYIQVLEISDHYK
ncbi:MAG: type II toxin-antitoxin system RelE/ParE family toxin [Pseudanabaena sp.]|jgi:proteic killer suppression protein|nr:type II toxin-antitoxin system RelE/ParE family toxin [Pseudanabaena sp. M176S2SP2A07QC]MCA6537235.1 type II toxin-antitoxin system RelE/ParE family toxin [Pseudanabaena sp. M037S2SP2A07QC]MCA6545041.1 type II toxin-antitoxin system RelE/ParE family toxin [Pseudanabaena sp. M074S1SP2A07QC]MCA6548996.1 type II toxin-antitoxin system RelE/ParE family toxin [Pseudanabaena sp. M152S2SP2A07QC]MCA6553331.1 type II toxin-antitoxin system RelE/ParE family toxin [Pseudanabaena sp. M135S2SP2A07QC]MCA